MRCISYESDIDMLTGPARLATDRQFHEERMWSSTRHAYEGPTGSDLCFIFKKQFKDR